jgi:hypothetical protein
MPAEHADKFIHPGKGGLDGILAAVTIRPVHYQIDLGPHHRPALSNDLAGRIFRFQAELPTKACRSGKGDNLKKTTSAYPCFLPLFLFHVVQSIFFGLRIIDCSKDLRKKLSRQGINFPLLSLALWDRSKGHCYLNGYLGLFLILITDFVKSLLLNLVKEKILAGRIQKNVP